MRKDKQLYPNNRKNWNFGCAKVFGLIDRKRPHISNIGSFTIDQSRVLSRQPKSNSSGCWGISLLAGCFLLFLAGCRYSSGHLDPEKMTSINIIDHNGLSETINSKERLNAFEEVDFLSPQPYQKVLRVYGRQKNGDISSCITSYHPNGQIKQYLDAINHRASGMYREWYANGKLKVEAFVIGGCADINTQAEQSWLFDGINKAWDEDGRVVAEIHYVKGELEGDTLYYHPNGQIWKICPYNKDKLHGTCKIFLEDGSLFQSVAFFEGEKNGKAFRYWPSHQIAYQETYEKGLLKEGSYLSSDGSFVSSVIQGKGYRAIFGKNDLHELQYYQNGIQEGCVKVFDENQNLISTYFIKNGEKQGEEIIYFPASSQPKLLLTWHEGILQGLFKTWYENGQLESQREMNGNQKHGLLTAWYRNGALMLVEDYDSDKLLKGEYYRLGEKTAITQIEKGKGIATLFNSEGNFSRKIYYQDGKPIE